MLAHLFVYLLILMNIRFFDEQVGLIEDEVSNGKRWKESILLSSKRSHQHSAPHSKVCVYASLQSAVGETTTGYGDEGTMTPTDTLMK